MKLAILGSGKIVQETLPTLRELPFEQLVLFGRKESREKLERLQTQYHLDEIYYDYEQLLNSEIDTVYIALPNDLHFSYAMKAIEAGKHVILEKPAVPNVRDFQTLCKAAKKHRVILVEAMSVHHLPMYRKVKELLPKIGTLKIVSLNFSQYSSRYDRFKEGIMTPAFDPAQYGGALMDLNVYNIHLLCGLFGQPISYSYNANMERGIDTSGILTLSYPGFQAVAIAAKDCEAAPTSTIQGTDGRIVIDQPANRFTDIHLIYNDGTKEDYRSDDSVYRLQYEFETFLRIINDRDFKEADRLNTISEQAIEILERSAQKAGIVYGKNTPETI